MSQPKTSARRDAEPYIVIINADEDPVGWLRERQKYITATDVPSILGVPGARDALETWYQKKDALMARSEAESIRSAKAAGHDFEDSNAAMFSQKTKRRVLRSQELIVSTAYPWLSATLDYEQSKTGSVVTFEWPSPLELKNAGSYAAEEMWPLGGEAHLTWQVQLQTQMIVMASIYGSLSAWLGSPFVHHRWQDYDYDSGLGTLIVEETRRFFKSLKRKSPPRDLVNPATAYEVLRRLSPATATRKVISLPREAVSLDCDIEVLTKVLERAQGEVIKAKATLEKEKSKLAALIGENDGGKLTGGTVWTFRHIHVPAHTVAAHSYRKLNRQSAASSKPKKVTWKTSK